MTTLTLIAAGVALLGILAAVAAWLIDARRRAGAPAAPRRAHELEEHVGDLLTGPVHRYGRIFAHYEVWRDAEHTRLELKAAPPWRKLNALARSLVIRYLWQALERVAGSAVVVVDMPRQEWDAQQDAAFKDEGWDWLTLPNPWTLGPQFINE